MQRTDRSRSRERSLVIRAALVACVFGALLSAGCESSSPADADDVPLIDVVSRAPFDATVEFESRCAQCHNGGVPHAPHIVTFQMLGGDAIFEALTAGSMAIHAQGLSDAQKRALADQYGGSSADDEPVAMCPPGQNRPSVERLVMDGWGVDAANRRFFAAEVAQLDAADVPRLELAWAFSYPGATRARSQPLVVGDTLIVGGQDGRVFALDAASGCARWTFQADAEVRSSVTIDGTSADAAVYAGDIQGNLYRIALVSGRLQWRTRVHDHPDATITGSPRYHDGRVFVPVSSSEWASAADPGYACCTFQGAVVAFDAIEGRKLWSASSIEQTPQPTGEKTPAGSDRFHPAGAPIWNSPTIDAQRNRLYVGTGEAYTSPAAPSSDAVLAFDLDSGRRLWTYQSISGDAWNMACFIGGGANCPVEDGPDLDIGASPVLETLADGTQRLLVGQKSGDVFALDPDDGALVWRTKIGRGGFAGGVHWGMATDGERLYAPNADTTFTGRFTGTPKPGLFALDPATGSEVWFTPAPDVCAADERPACDPGLSAAVSAIPGIVFAGAFDGHLRAYDSADGRILWDFDTNRAFETVSGVVARGGSIESDGPVIVGGWVYVNSGYLFGDRMPGNVLLAFNVPD